MEDLFENESTNKLAQYIANGFISVEDLANAEELIARAKLVTNALKACKNQIVFPMGTEEIKCYDYTDKAGEHHAWGMCNFNGDFLCYTTWGGEHLIGKVNLNNFSQVFMAFENEEFARDLNRFLEDILKKEEESKKSKFQM